MYGRYIRDLPHTAYDEKGKTPVVVAGSQEQLQVHSMTLLNGAAVAQDMAAMIKHDPSEFRIFRFTAIGSVYTEVSSELRAGTPTALMTTANGDGFVIGSKHKINLIGLAVTQDANGGPVFVFEYWDGSAWVACPAVIDTPTFATGDQLFVQLAPHKWVQGGVAAGDVSDYHLRIRATTAPAQDMIADEVWVARMMWYGAAIPPSGLLHVRYPDREPRPLEGGESLMPYFSVADVKNCVAVQYVSHK